jgi:Lrp/AsnC family leucine-responsive transcriptional regulator
MEIDRIDRAILAQLQADGRLSNAELARRVNLSPPACLERVRRLERVGLIRGYVALLDPGMLGGGMLVFIEIVLDRTTPEVFERFKEAIATMPEIQECYMVAGGFDYLVKARVRDMAAYRDFLGTTLVALPGVRETHTYAVMEEVKATTAIALPPA